MTEDQPLMRYLSLGKFLSFLRTKSLYFAPVAKMSDLNEGMLYPKEIIARLFKWEAKLSIGEYNKLPENMRKVADKVLTIEKAMPTLEIVTSKMGTE